MKTENEILTDLYHLCKDYSGITDLLYKNVRPTDSKNEDCVIRCTTGTTGKFISNATLSVIIFHQPIEIDSTIVIDTAKSTQNELLLKDFSEYLYIKMNGYKVMLDSREIRSALDNNTQQSYTILKITVNY